MAKKKSDNSNQGLWIPQELWADENLSITEKCFLARIMSLDNEDNCFAGNSYFSDFFKLSPGRCSQIILSLEQKKYIEIKYIRDGKQIKGRKIKVFNKLNRGYLKNNRGYLENDDTPILKTKEGYLENDEENNTYINNTEINNTTNTHMCENSEESKKKKSKNTTKGKLIKKDIEKCDEFFEKFWSEYPKKIGNGAAKNSMYKINPDSELQNKILTELKKQKESYQWSREGGAFIPNASTWLNQKRWNDELPKNFGNPNPKTTYNEDKFKKFENDPLYYLRTGGDEH